MNTQKFTTWAIYLGIGYGLAIVLMLNHQMSQLAIVLALLVAGGVYLSGKSPVGLGKLLAGCGYTVFVAVLVRLFLARVCQIPLFDPLLLEGPGGGLTFSLRHPSSSISEQLLWELVCLGVVLGIVVALLHGGDKAQLRVAKAVFYLCLVALVGRVMMFNHSFNHLVSATMSLGQSSVSRVAVGLDNKAKITADQARQKSYRGDLLPMMQLVRDVELLDRNWQMVGSLKQGEWVKVNLALTLPDRPSRTDQKFVFVGQQKASGLWEIEGFVPITAIGESEPEPKAKLPTKNQSDVGSQTAKASSARSWYVDTNTTTQTTVVVDLAPGDQSEPWYIQARDIVSYRISCSQNVPHVITINGQEFYSTGTGQFDFPTIYNVGRIIVRLPLQDKNGTTLTQGATIKLRLKKQEG
ncbi:MAG: hypothetical protein A3A24_01115 [Candidatus Buchananbacteria bacterium RIFCSPLOWO2_01_FULL_46_12]|uniref:Uncharacterized protein n=2 Tax=Candidatus Buchananiibacteriota TaxID=1817903 RepID=A0A1G1YRY6_9BACT|nr:MAG: hypothetical protein A2744_00305 [Candidatus Buchananbacteria bacterium RIFCSPHIGHO2_01_FULL_44_11]OGY55064.1 MAG: hypothetical protein A3A24_01115 [Candidatus Buchananbacteria bacterium RIFCSPLOWO2_01_FULL_46_12]